jgi:nucleoside-diphosphate-sugar epimerase
MQNNNKTIAITGVTGFLGSHLARSLYSDGYKIIGFGRAKKPSSEIYKYSEYVRWDITKSFSKIRESADFFIHTASYVKFWGDKKEIYDTNVVGTVNAINTAKKMHSKTFVYISSASVYDPFLDKINVAESAPYAKRYLNYYAETKVQAEKIVQNSSCFY